jgi:hypothetical protein
MTKFTIDFFIHDSEIITVIEDTQNDTLDFILNYPVDWDNNIFVKKILRFHNCLNYTINEIPFASSPIIFDIKDYGEVKYSIGEGRNIIDIHKRKIELITNTGTRTLEYDNLELIDYK